MSILKEKLKKIANKELSVVDETRKQLVLAKKYVEYNFFITLNLEKALDKARILDEYIATCKSADEILSKYPLIGLTCGYKDVFSTKDIETTAASNILKGYIPSYNATVVQKLEDAGVINLGKLNCDAFAHGGTGTNSDFGASHNPYNFDKVCGGSSSASAGVVAAEICDFAIGTDTGGSIRCPANWTNTVGLKVTYGRVSRYGVIAMASSFDTIGHFTKQVEDAAMILKYTAGQDKYDGTSSVVAVGDYDLFDISANTNLPLKGKKIGFIKEFFTQDVDKEILEKTQNTLKLIQELGAELVEVSIPSIEFSLPAYYTLVPSEISSNLGKFDGIRFGHDRSKFGDEAKRRIMIGSYVLSSGYYDAYYKKASQVRTIVRDDFNKALSNVDMLIGPVTPVKAPNLTNYSLTTLQEYLIDIMTVSINLAGVPALSIPAGFDLEGMPIGVQLIGPHFGEKELFEVANVIEQKTRYYTQGPRLSRIFTE